MSKSLYCCLFSDFGSFMLSIVEPSLPISIDRFVDFEPTHFYCPNNCGRKYKYKTGLCAHLKFECGKEPQFHCKFCSKKFTLKGNLKTHYALVHKHVMQ